MELDSLPLSITQTEGFTLICCQLPALLLVNVMNIITNNQPRDLMHLCDFSQSDQDKIRKQFDWMHPDSIEYNYGFFKYRGEFYHLCDFISTPAESTSELQHWEGYSSDSYFSGTVVRLVEGDCDRVVVGRYSS